MSTNIISQLFYSHFDEDKFKSHVTNHISHVTNHISQITCHKSHVTNQISLYIQIEAFLLVLFWFHSLALTNRSIFISIVLVSQFGAYKLCICIQIVNQVFV